MTSIPTRELCVDRTNNVTKERSGTEKGFRNKQKNAESFGCIYDN